LQGAEANPDGESHKRKESGQVAATKRFGKFQQLIGLLVLAAITLSAMPPQVAYAQSGEPRVYEFPSQGYGDGVYGQKYELNLLRMLNAMSPTGSIPVTKDGIIDCVSFIGYDGIDKVDESFAGDGSDSLDPAEGYYILNNFRGSPTKGAGACDVCSMLYEVLAQEGFKLAEGHTKTKHPKLAGVQDKYSISIFSTDPAQNIWLQNKNESDVTVRWQFNKDSNKIQFWVEGPGTGNNSPPPVEKQDEPAQSSDYPVGSPVDTYSISPLGVRQGCEMEGGCDEPFQTGIDLIAALGAPVQSTIDGKVVAIGTDSFGNSYVHIESEGWVERHRHGNYTVTLGQEVKQGDQIGSVGQIGIEDQAFPVEFFSLYDKATGQNLQNVEQYQEVFARKPKWWIFTIPGEKPSVEVTLSPEMKDEVVNWWNQVLTEAQALTTPVPSQNSTSIIQSDNGRIVIGHLDLGARIEATGNNTPVDLKTHLAELGQYGVCTANGSYFESGGALSFPFIKDGTIITEGAIPTEGWNIRVLYANGSEVYVTSSIDMTYKGDMLVGLVPDRTEASTGVTLVGVKGRDVYFSVTNGTVAQAVDDLVARGVPEDKIVMFDGGSSRQLLCADGTAIAPDTQIPQGVGIVAGTDVAAWFTAPLPEDNWAPVDETALVNTKASTMINNLVETTYPSGIAVHHSTGALAGDWFDQTLGVHLGENRVTYNMVIGGDGVAHLTSKFGAASYHARCYDNNVEGQCPNWDYFSIVLTGNFMNDEPTPAQLATLEKAIRWAISNGAAPNVLGHRDIAKTLGVNSYSTECPGDSLYYQLPEVVKKATSPEMPITIPRAYANLSANNILIIIALVLTLVIALIVWVVIVALKPEIRWRQYYKKSAPKREPSEINKKLWLFFKIYGVIWVIIITAHRAWLARYELWSVMPDPSEGFELRLWVPGYILYLLPVVLLIAVLLRAATRVSFKQKRVLLPDAPVKPPTKAEIRRARRWRVFRVVSILLIIALSMYVFGGALTFAFGERPTAPAPSPIPMEPAEEMQDIPAFFKTEVRSLAVQVDKIAREVFPRFLMGEGEGWFPMSFGAVRYCPGFL